MMKVLIDLFFPDPHRPGEFPGAHSLSTQEVDHLLTNRSYVFPVIFILLLRSQWGHILTMTLPLITSITSRPGNACLFSENFVKQNLMEDTKSKI